MSHRVFTVPYFSVRPSWSSDYCNKRLSWFQIYLGVAHRVLDWVGEEKLKEVFLWGQGTPATPQTKISLHNINNIFVHLKLANLSKEKHWAFHSCIPLHGSSQIKICTNGTQSTTCNLWQLNCVRPAKTHYFLILVLVGGGGEGCLDFPFNLSKILKNMREIEPHVGTYICLTYTK